MTEQIQLSEHPIYKQNVSLWKRIKAYIDIDRALLKSKDFLWYHPSEELGNQQLSGNQKQDQRVVDAAKKDRMLREQRTQYTDHLGTVLERFTDLIVKGGLDTSELEKDPQFKDIINDMDGKKSDINLVAKKLAENIIQYGKCYILTDTFESNAKTLADANSMKLRPFWEVIDPLCLVDWNEDDNFQLTAFRYQYELTAQRANLVNSSPVVNTYSKVYEQESKTAVVKVVRYILQKDQGKWKEDKVFTVDFKFIPLARSGDFKSHLNRAEPIVSKIYNKESNKDNILYNAGYDKIFIITDLSKLRNESGDDVDDAEIQLYITSSTAITLPIGSDAKKIDPTDLSQFRTAILDDINELMRVAFGITRTVSQDSKAVEGADSQRQTQESLFNKAAQVRKNVLDCMNEALVHFYKFAGVTSEPPKLQFKQKVDDLSIDEFIKFVKEIGERAYKYETLRKAIDKRLVSSMDLADEAEIVAEIQKSKPETQVRAEQQRTNLTALLPQNSTARVNQ